MPGKSDSPIYPAPIAFEGAHFEAAYFPTAAAFAVAVRPVGAVPPVAPEAAFAAAPTAAVEVSADHLGTGPRQSPPIQHMDPPAGRKLSREKRLGTMQAYTAS